MEETFIYFVARNSFKPHKNASYPQREIISGVLTDACLNSKRKWVVISLATAKEKYHIYIDPKDISDGLKNCLLRNHRKPVDAIVRNGQLIITGQTEKFAEACEEEDSLQRHLAAQQNRNEILRGEVDRLASENKELARQVDALEHQKAEHLKAKNKALEEIDSDKLLAQNRKYHSDTCVRLPPHYRSLAETIMKYESRKGIFVERDGEIYRIVCALLDDDGRLVLHGSHKPIMVSTPNKKKEMTNKS